MIASSLDQTIKYAAFFNASLTLKDLHFWLISPQKKSFLTVKKFIFSHPDIQKKLITKPVAQKILLTKKKIKNIQKLIFVIKRVPTIRLIALTGSLSVDNPKKDDDIDLMIITSPNTLWLTRPLVIFITAILAKRRKAGSPASVSDSICINLWLDQTSLLIPKKKQNLYTAHEVLQAKPLFDRGGIHHQFISANSWVKKYLANAYEQIYPRTTRVPHRTLAPRRGGVGTVQMWNPFIKTLNLLAFRLQHLYMKPKITNEHITPHAAYFHPRNLYPKIKKSLR